MKLFGTDGIRGEFEKEPITVKSFENIGLAFANFIGGKKVCIGMDTRDSSLPLKNAIIEGLVKGGCEVYDLGVVTTPAAGFITKINFDAGLMITASHNPHNHNGVKFFASKGIKYSDAEEKQIERIFSEGPKETDKGSYQQSHTEIEKYKDLLETVGEDLFGLKVVVDPANGASTYLIEIFKELGAELIAISNNPNGKNINESCGALHPERLAKTVKEEKADVGFAFDGDADRIVLVDEFGRVLDGDYIMALIGSHMIRENSLKKNTIVTTKYSNMGLSEVIRGEGGSVEVVENGDKYVIQRLIEKDLNFGGEKAGHIILFDYGVCGDGLLCALKIANIMKKTNKKISTLVEHYHPKPQYQLNVEVEEKKPFSNEMKEKIKFVENELSENGRVYVRYSGTENKLRIMIEGENEQIIKKYAKEIADEVK